MDRGRHREILSAAAAGVMALLAGMGVLRAQGPSPVPPASVAPTATPWVQAPPPSTGSPARLLHDKPLAQAPSSSPTAFPSATPSREEIAKVMARKREEELARQPPPPVKPPRTMPQLTPEEKEAYERNLTLWQAMPPEERQAIRGEATERNRVETEKAYESSGLHLNGDQREVFALRYRQERRRLERELQEKARAERERRLPEIIEQIKHEFPAPAAAANPPKPAPTPAK